MWNSRNLGYDLTPWVSRDKDKKKTKNPPQLQQQQKTQNHENITEYYKYRVNMVNRIL